MYLDVCYMKDNKRYIYIQVFIYKCKVKKFESLILKK